MILSEARLKKGITQLEMSRKLGIAVSTYNMYENAQRKIPLHIAKNIAKIVELSMEELFIPSTFTIHKTDK